MLVPLAIQFALDIACLSLSSSCRIGRTLHRPLASLWVLVLRLQQQILFPWRLRSCPRPFVSFWNSLYFFCNQGWPWTPIPRITGWPILCTLSSSHTIIMYWGVKTVFFCCSHRTTAPGQFSGCERFALGWEVCFGITIQQLFSSRFFFIYFFYK